MILPNRDRVKTVAAIHQQDGATRVVIAALRGGGGAGGDVEIKAAESIHGGGAGGPAQFTALIDRFGGVDAVIRVLPPALTIARVVGLPVTSSEGEGPQAGNAPAAMADALTLMAESELPAAIPPFRRASGLINPGKGNGGSGRKPIGLLTGWPETAELTGQNLPRVAPEVCISEAPALAMLAQLLGGVERAWTHDRTGHAMTLLAAGHEKTVVRVARVPEPSSMSSAVAETSRAAGIAGSAAPIDSTGWLTLDPAPASPRVAGALRSSDWINQYGLAAAAIIAFADPNPAVSSHVGLHAIEPKAKPPVLQRVTEWLGRPGRAAAIIVACLAAVLALPIGVTYAKLRLLQKRVPDTAKIETDNQQADRELAFYRALRDKRWPMTKLLADIASSCPEGVHLDTVEIGQGDGITLRGVADDTGKVTTFRENLGKTNVFADPTTPQVSNALDGGVQFQLQAKVPSNRAAFASKPIDDFVEKPLLVRLYPDVKPPPRRSTSSPSPRTEHAAGDHPGSDRTDHTASSDRSTRDRSSRTDRRTSDPSSRSSRDASSRETPSRDARASTASASKSQQPTIPPTLSDEAIARLSADDAMKEWATRKKAAAQPGIDDATKKRLQDESDKAKARMQAARNGGGS